MCRLGVKNLIIVFTITHCGQYLFFALINNSEFSQEVMLSQQYSITNMICSHIEQITKCMPRGNA